ncbi:hypothetical protein RRK28_000309 [Staphylococcus pseudintermedius]|nr:hypothetical protein [Staphylococcus pseudintermedius]
MPLYTVDGLRFENEEEAINWFLTTLSDKSPVGSFYEYLHEQNWGDYSIQASGISEQEFHIVLDAANHKEKVYRGVAINTYNEPVEITKEELAKTLKEVSKSVDVAAIVANGEISKIEDKIKADETLNDDLIADFKNLVLRVVAEIDKYGGRMIFAITDTITGKQLQSYLVIEENRIDVDLIKELIEGMFKKTIEGEFNGDEFKIGETSLNHIFDYASENKKKIKIEIID